MQLLRRDVRGCAGDANRRRGQGLDTHDFGNAEIGQIRIALFVQQDIAGFEIAMDDALPVRRRQR